MNRRTFLRMIPAAPLGVAAMATAPTYATGGVVTWVGEGRCGVLSDHHLALPPKITIHVENDNGEWRQVRQTAGDDVIQLWVRALDPLP